jgi:hypothetical protein
MTQLLVGKSFSPVFQKNEKSGKLASRNTVRKNLLNSNQHGQFRLGGEGDILDCEM